MEYPPEPEQSSRSGGLPGACPEQASRLMWRDHTVDALRLLATGQ